jgi:proteic killer suppression protein
VIKTFTDKYTEELYLSGTSRRFPRDIVKRATRKLEQLNAANTLDDLRIPPSNRLHALQGDRAGQHTIRINDQWRICFTFHNGDAYNVEVCDYH